MPAFMLGCPRSGTYLLCSVIDSHLPVAAPVEPQFIPIFRPFLTLWGDLAVAENRRLLLEAIYDFLEIWTPRSERGKDLGKVWAHSLMATRDRAETIVAGSSSYDTLVERMFEEFARAAEKELALDKSAFYAFVPPERLSDGPAKFVDIVRDGRDVCLSWMKSWFGPPTVAEAAREWREHVLGGRRWGAAHPERYLEVRYEQLIGDPRAALSKVAGFLGVRGKPFDRETHLSSSMVGALAGGSGDHAMITQGINPANRDKWRNEMSAADRRVFELVAGDALRECGYPVDGAKAGALDLARVAWSYPRAWLSVRRWRRIAKAWLPLALWLSQRLRFPLARLLTPRGFGASPRS